MKMPIVSLNAMAMNESVAATCCYKQEQINGYFYETVLSGGSMTYVIDTNKNLKVDSTWLSLPGDYDEAFTAGTKIVTVAGVDYCLDGSDLKKISELTVRDYWKYCDHTKSDCTYWFQASTPTATYSHVGSTVEHTAGGKTWAEPHQAVRFNS